ncbi:unnamed protein product [Boreogadus saida]
MWVKETEPRPSPPLLTPPLCSAGEGTRGLGGILVPSLFAKPGPLGAAPVPGICRCGPGSSFKRACLYTKSPVEGTPTGEPPAPPVVGGSKPSSSLTQQSSEWFGNNNNNHHQQHQQHQQQQQQQGQGQTSERLLKRERPAHCHCAIEQYRAGVKSASRWASRRWFDIQMWSRVQV